MVEYFTQEGIEKLKEELKRLKTTEAREIAKLLKHAISQGDLKENAGYDDAKDRQAALLHKIAEIETVISKAVVYEKKETDKIQIGCSVLLLLDGKEEKMEIVAPSESNILKNKISYQSPLGQKLIGKGIGKEFDFKNGKEKITVKILKIY